MPRAPSSFPTILSRRAASPRRSAWPAVSSAKASRAILSSDYARAAATAEHLQPAHGRRPSATDPLLQERNFGDLRGTPYAELGFDMFAPDYAPPNGETWEVFHARVDHAWALVQETAAAAGGHSRGRDARARLPLAGRDVT